jgi:hypothetical protein
MLIDTPPGQIKHGETRHRRQRHDERVVDICAFQTMLSHRAEQQACLWNK